ncbi:hypothetical protein FEM48_Zijuj05G0021300 [Ziziphus jujuba var. spinosa]|uniref:Uncharacterized protein n=1 Tax=Ziziphus jujuba var. spinosa TaxID=714518 RepID=A0A978VC70_ZIZJJ|nr:hypothetical protein FEM48_Zijuj05G0021300 [Ziziphus jujuba var. spinosa]
MLVVCRYNERTAPGLRFNHNFHTFCSWLVKECRQAGKYSGGMKRRLSVAISQNGDAKLCLIRTLLPSSVRVFLPHSMEEAEFLCDRLGIMANGSLQCIGNSKEVA